MWLAASERVTVSEGSLRLFHNKLRLIELAIKLYQEF